MLSLDLIPGRSWLVCRQLDQPYEYEPRGNCHEPITATIAAIGATEAATAAAAVIPTIAETAALFPGAAAASLPAYAAANAGIAAGASSGISLGTLGTVASVGGTLLQAKAGLDNADYQAAVARSEAAALKQKANEDAAAAQRAAITQNKKTELVQSRLRALAANSGTDATSPDILTTEGRIAEQGQYNALSSLYEGQSRARSDTYQADIDLFKANRIETAAPLTAAGTILSGIGSFADRRALLKAGARNPTSFFGFGV
jgi:hypothetical protein